MWWILGAGAVVASLVLALAICRSAARADDAVARADDAVARVMREDTRLRSASRGALRDGDHIVIELDDGTGRPFRVRPLSSREWRGSVTGDDSAAGRK